MLGRAIAQSTGPSYTQNCTHLLNPHAFRILSYSHHAYMFKVIKLRVPTLILKILFLHNLI